VPADGRECIEQETLSPNASRTEMISIRGRVSGHEGRDSYDRPQGARHPSPLMLHRLLILGQSPFELARKEGVTIEQLCEEFGEDLRLREDIGWVSRAIES